jgi:predicted nucleic acid-binding protein
VPALLIRRRFGDPVALDPGPPARAARRLRRGRDRRRASYDAFIAVTASAAGRRLLTRDARAAATYTALSVPFEVIR